MLKARRFSVFNGVIVDAGLEEGYLARITGFMRSNREGTGVKGRSLSRASASVEGGEGELGGLVGFPGWRVRLGAFSSSSLSSLSSSSRVGRFPARSRLWLALLYFPAGRCRGLVGAGIAGCE